MVGSAESWHVPYISKHRVQDPSDCLNVVFLQRVSDEEHTQITDSLGEVDEDWMCTLDVPKPRSRTLVVKKWIRDFWPRSEVILEIARHAYRGEDKSYRSLIFVDSGWEAGNVIAARWEGEGDNSRLNAVRVRMNIAEPLLSVCDLNEGCTLAQVLGNEAFEDAKVDFYIDATPQLQDDTKSPEQDYEIPEFLPHDIVLSKTEVHIISLKHLGQSEIEGLIRGIINGHESKDPAPPMKIHNWHGSYIKRTKIHKLYRCIQQKSSETDRNMPLFLVDMLLEGPDGKPQLISASDSTDWREKTVQIMPLKTEKLLSLWQEATQGLLEDCFTETEDYADVWNAEYVYDLDVHRNFGQMTGAPIFYLQPFSLEEERVVRTKLRELNDIEQDEDWGKDWIYLGYIWSDGGKKHSIEELRDLFESCDHFSPSFDSKKPGPFQLFDYPYHFIAVDDRILEPEPKVWLASALDFHLDDVGDQLGWLYGLIDAKEAHLAWVNLDIANMGPGDFFDTNQLWLSDMKEARREWEELRAEDFA